MKQKNFVYQPKEWWKNEIGFDIDKEFLIYQYLCGNLRKWKIKKIDKEKRFCRYKSWREYLQSNLEKYDDELLNEFYHFLKLQKTACDVDMGMHTSLLVPFIVSFLSGGLIQTVMSGYKGDDISLLFDSIFQQMPQGVLGLIAGVIAISIAFIVVIIAILAIPGALFAYFYFTMRPYVRNKYMSAFWRDYIDITKAVVEAKRKKAKHKEG